MTSAVFTTTFDESNLEPNTGLLLAAVLAQRIDLAGLFEERLHLARAWRQQRHHDADGDRADPDRRGQHR